MRPPFILRHTNAYGEWHFFQNLGGPWPASTGHPERRLIERTTSRKKDARTFETADEAAEIIVKAGSPAGWEVLDSEGAVA